MWPSRGYWVHLQVFVVVSDFTGFGHSRLEIHLTFPDGSKSALKSEEHVITKTQFKTKQGYKVISTIYVKQNELITS